MAGSFFFFLSESACSYTREPFYFLFYLLHSLQWFSVCWTVRDLLAVQCHHEGQQCVFLRASKCVAIYLALMAICHNARHYQFIGHPLLLCSLNTNMTPSIQFPPAATGPNHSRSYQHCSQTTIKLSGWGKHQHSCPHPDPYTYIDEVVQTPQKTSSLCFFFFIHLPHMRKRAILCRKFPLCLLAKAPVDVMHCQVMYFSGSLEPCCVWSSSCNKIIYAIKYAKQANDTNT